MDLRYALVVDSWGEWEEDGRFDTLAHAIRRGHYIYPENRWRVINRESLHAEWIAYEHNPFTVMQEVARSELERAAFTRAFRERLYERHQARVQAAEQRRRLVEQGHVHRATNARTTWTVELHGSEDSHGANWKVEGF